MRMSRGGCRRSIGLAMKALLALGMINVLPTSVMAADKPALSAFTAKVDKLVADASAPQTAPLPTAAPSIAKGKTLVVIPCAMGAEGCARPARAVQEAAALLGWKAILIDPAGDPSKMGNAVQQAISIKADAIVLGAVDAATILGDLQLAKQAGIKIAAYVAVDKDKTFDIQIPTEESVFDDGYVMGAAAYKQGNGKLHMIEMRGDEFHININRAEGTNAFIKDCAAAGGDCALLSSENFLVTDLTTRVPQQAVAQVRLHPTFNVFWAAYDAGLTFMIQGLRQADLTDQGFAVGFDANVANLDIIRNDGYEKISVGQPIERIGYALVDQLNRLFQGEPLVNQGIHSKVLTKDNLPPSGAWEGDVDFRSGYKKLWGIK
jgi:ribose transport system substrate-binding protein